MTAAKPLPETLTTDAHHLITRLLDKELGRIISRIEEGYIDHLPYLIAKRDKVYAICVEMGHMPAFNIARTEKTAKVFPFIPALSRPQVAA